MATLEDKILGEKLHNYCSSSEDDDDDDNSDSDNANKINNQSAGPELPEINKWEGTSTNTGPKGVIKDWEKFKELEVEKRTREERERIEMMKKMTLTVRTTLDEEKEKAALEDRELSELLDDEFIHAYNKQRMEEMLEKTNHNIRFGSLIFLKSSNDFLEAVDNENKKVTVIVHLYEEGNEACRTMNNCLKRLSEVYWNVKFCSIIGSLAGISNKFKIEGVPALLVYKAGQLIGNFVRLSDEFGAHFLPEDVQAFLVEHGLIEDKSCTPYLIRSTTPDSDSD